jgi:hypothetical protein
VISREELYGLVWSKPMSKVAAQFQVSGSYMARVCTLLNVPRPERGYWAKLTVGKAPPREPLPQALPGDQLHWIKVRELPPPPKPRRQPEYRARVKLRIPKNRMYSLVRGAKQHFENSRPVDEGAYLKPRKRLLVDVTASKGCLTYRIALRRTGVVAAETSPAVSSDRMRAPIWRSRPHSSSLFHSSAIFPFSKR